MARLALHPIGSPLPRDAGLNRAAMTPLEARLAERRAVAEGGWGPEYAERCHRRGS